jgi:HAE1 family hydrophobic/amphiphilic exporter-1
VLNKNIDVANQEVKDKVDQILNDLPDDAEKPIIHKVDNSSSISSGPCSLVGI